MRSHVQGAHNGEYRVWDCNVMTELLQVISFRNWFKIWTARNKEKRRLNTNNVNEPQFYRLNCGSQLFCFVLFIRGSGDRCSYGCRSHDLRTHGLLRDDGRDDCTVHSG